MFIQLIILQGTSALAKRAPCTQPKKLVLILWGTQMGYATSFAGG